MSGTRIVVGARLVLATCQQDGCRWRVTDAEASAQVILSHVAATGHSVHVCTTSCADYAPARTAAVTA